MMDNNYKDRLCEEYFQLHDRWMKLSDMLLKWDKGELDYEPMSSKELLMSQLRIMGEYLGILTDRALAEHVALVKPGNFDTRPPFKLEYYSDKNAVYCMHCHDKHDTAVFCKFLDEHGRTWAYGEKYSNPGWKYPDDIVFYFNEGTYDRLAYAESEDEDHPVILDFQDYCWPEYTAE